MLLHLLHPFYQLSVHSLRHTCVNYLSTLAQFVPELDCDGCLKGQALPTLWPHYGQGWKHYGQGTSQIHGGQGAVHNPSWSVTVVLSIWRSSTETHHSRTVYKKIL